MSILCRRDKIHKIDKMVSVKWIASSFTIHERRKRGNHTRSLFLQMASFTHIGLVTVPIVWRCLFRHLKWNGIKLDREKIIPILEQILSNQRRSLLDPLQASVSFENYCYFLYKLQMTKFTTASEYVESILQRYHDIVETNVIEGIRDTIRLCFTNYQGLVKNFLFKTKKTGFSISYQSFKIKTTVNRFYDPKL